MDMNDVEFLPDEPEIAVSGGGVALLPGPADVGSVRPFHEASVMMIDDEPTTVDIVRGLLEVNGYDDFRGETDPVVGVQRVIAERPDVLLLDLMMPGMSGFEVLRRVRRDPQSAAMPVIVMTSASDSRTKMRVLELGATDFLEKPVDPSELVLRLRNTLAFKAVRDRSAWFDLLTELPNRRLLLSRTAIAMRRSVASQTSCALLHIEITRLRELTQAFGQRVADEAVREIAQRVKLQLGAEPAAEGRGDDAHRAMVARSGPDDLTVLIPVLQRAEDAEPLARRLLATFEKPVSLDGRDWYPMAAIGIAAGPQDAAEPEALLRCASAAATAVRSRPGGGFGYYSPAQNDAAVRRMTMEAQLRRAIDRDEFVLHYQPKIDMEIGLTIGCEALLRWRHPERGMVPPAEFIPVAEQAGLIVDVGTWVLHEACRAARRWLDAGTPCRVAVNIASPHFHDGRLLRDVKSALDAVGLPPDLLVVELTESMLMGSAEESLRTLHELKTLGVSISLDDFGTGYSSLAYLKRMPLDELKIDCSFVSGLPDDDENLAIVRAVIAMSGSLGLSVIAEGVETERQARALLMLGCTACQGWLYAKALPETAFVHRLAEDAARLREHREHPPTIDASAGATSAAAAGA
jgi:diguanylate cyclase (GGDEF)-like protein